MTDEEKLLLAVQVGDAFHARDFDALAALLHPAFEFHEPPEQPGARVFRGHDEARDGFARWWDTWVEQSSDAQGFEILPDGRLLAFTRERMLGRDGLRVQNDNGNIFAFRDGKVLRWQSFWDPAGARAAAGLSG